MKPAIEKPKAAIRVRTHVRAGKGMIARGKGAFNKARAKA